MKCSKILGSAVCLLIIASMSMMQCSCPESCPNEKSVPKPIPSNLAIRFRNCSNQKVHALVIYTPDFKEVFKIGAWSKKSLDLLENFSLKSAALFPDDDKKDKKKSDKTSETKKETASAANPAAIKTAAKTIKIPKKDIAVAFVNGVSSITNYLSDTLLDPEVILSNMKKKDYFDVFPCQAIDTCSNPKDSQTKSNITSYKKKGDLTLAIYPDDEYGLTDFAAPLFIQDFNLAKYNAIAYGPEPGHVTYQYINPSTGEVTKSKEKLFVPMKVDSTGAIKVNKQAYDELNKKEEELGGTIEFE